MSKGKRFKTKKKKRFVNFIAFYTIIVFFMFINYTFSRYTGTTEITAGIEIAKFTIKVNETTVEQNNTFELKLSPTTNTTDNKISPDSTGYFDIEIDPTGTEVSLEYHISFDLTSIQNVSRKITLTQYSLDSGATTIEMPIDNIITGEILLDSNSSTGFTSSDKITIRVYWEWEEDIINPTITDLKTQTIDATATIKQKIQ